MADNLDHIRWLRIPETAPRHGRQNRNPPRPPLRTDLGQHGRKLEQDTNYSLQEARTQRVQLGIDPDRLLVLGFTFLNVNQRIAMEERFGVQVVEERDIAEIFDPPIFKLRIKFANTEQLQAFMEPDNLPLQVVRTDRLRNSNGSVDLSTVDVIFLDEESAQVFRCDNDTHSRWNITLKSSRVEKVAISAKTQLLVQFPDARAVTRFQGELALYRSGNNTVAELPLGLRRALFDALDNVSVLSAEDRRGARLKEEGFPVGATPFYFDVDLWHPGRGTALRDIIEQFNQVVRRNGGDITDPPSSVADTLLLARVRGNQQTLEALLDYGNAARVDLPPQFSAVNYAIFNPVIVPETLEALPDDAPLACVVDSGIVAGHPLLAGVIVEERDFDSGEGTPVDLAGHGTHVAGIVTYGSVRDCMANNQWVPKVRLLNAKVMRRAANGGTEFAYPKRAETQIREAITYYAQEQRCRIFNLSFGDEAMPYEGRRQLPLALLLDDLARQLDVVIVVAAGNVKTPDIPTNLAAADTFQKAIRDQLFSTDHLIIDPASAVNALTVGAIASNETPFSNQASPGRRILVASPINTPSPFTRTSQGSTGRGIKSVIKPDLVSDGGNYYLNGANQWIRNDPNLAVPSLRFDYATGGRLLSAACGTSVAAPFVTHVSAMVEAKLRQLFGEAKPSANLIRALVVHSASISTETEAWIGESLPLGKKERRLLRVAGYGIPNVDKAVFSTDNRPVLYAEDEIRDNSFHLYAIELPDSFINGTGKRRLKVTLAYDPPVRGTRLDYMGRIMWFQIYKGITSSDLLTRVSNAQEAGAPLQAIESNRVEARPPYTTLQQSTVQSATFEGSRAQRFNYRLSPNGPALWHILIGCNLRFSADASVRQKYAIVASLEHDNTDVRIYQTIKQRVQQRVRIQP